MQLSVGVLGASGFAGSEFLRIAAAHPLLDVVWASGETQAGVPISELYPALAPVYPDDRFVSYDPALLDGLDAVVLGMPHGASQPLVPELVASGVAIVDLAADFRLQDPADYDTWYGAAHTSPDLLPTFVYGLPELYRDRITGATRVAAPGCYPTAVLLALAPLVRAGLIEPSGLIVDAASGVSGAGRPPKPNTTFCTVDEDFTAYGLLDHRHTAEMQEHLGATVLFTPHLAPMNRGILATCYARPTAAAVSAGMSTDSLLGELSAAYDGEPFVVVSERSPSTKATQGSNCAHLSARFDHRTGTVIVLSAIDNLVKGTAGQAVQCLNLMFGLPEATGLPRVGFAP